MCLRYVCNISSSPAWSAGRWVEYTPLKRAAQKSGGLLLSSYVVGGAKGDAINLVIAEIILFIFIFDFGCYGKRYR